MVEKKERGSQGKLGPRWMKQTLQVPRDIGQDFRAQASEVGPGGVKVLGSLAIGLVNGMPDEMRKELASFVNSKTWVSADGLSSETLWTYFTAMLNDSAEPEQRLPDIHDDAPRFVDKILDPELTPPPGEKLSDRGGTMKTPKKAAPKKKRGSA